MHIKNKIYLTILSGLLFSTILSFYYVSKYDTYEISSDDFENHQMIKSDVAKFWRQANDLKNDLKNDVSFFKTGYEYRTPYLPPKILFFLSSSINLEFFDKIGKIKIDKKKVIILIFQALTYYLAVLFFFYQIKKTYSEKTVIFTIGFLCFEPTIMLFHSSLWSESIFFTIQLIFLTLLIKNSQNILINFTIGLILGLLLLQRSVAMLYIFPVVLYFIISFKKQFIKPTIFFIFGYLFVLIFLGYHNYSRSGVFYINSTQSKDGFYMYMLPTLISKKNDITINEANQKLRSEKNLWIKKNNLDLEKEKDRLDYYNYIHKKSLKFMIDNPYLTLQHISKKTMHFLVMDPLRHVHFFYKFEYKGQPETRYYKSHIQKKIIPVRISYTLIIYFICLFGFFHLLKNNKINHLTIILLSICYFILMCSWIGNTRYFAPCLIYISLLFGNGLQYLLDIKKIRF